MAGKGGNLQTPEQYAKPRHGSNSGSKLAKIRISLGLTQKQLGEMIGVKISAISMMEHLDALSVYQAKKVAPALGVDWKSLVE